VLQGKSNAAKASILSFLAKFSAIIHNVCLYIYLTNIIKYYEIRLNCIMWQTLPGPL